MPTFRKACRWLHRQMGYLAVGLTLVYAVSGFVVNHAHHWDPNYAHSREVSRIEPVGEGPTDEVAPLVLERLHLTEPVKSTWRATPRTLQVFLPRATLEVDLLTGEVVRDGFAKRPVIFDLNYLHFNTGRGPWTGISDVYAGMLVLLALTGIFTVRGRRGLAGRGGLLMGLGILLPIVYLLFERYV